MMDQENNAMTKEELFVMKRLVWHGILRRKDIENLLQISSDFASRIIGRVRSMITTTLEGKAYLFDGEVPIETSAQQFLEDVRRCVMAGGSMDFDVGTSIPAFVLSSPDQHVDSDVLRIIVRAIQTGRGVSISYTGTNLGDVTRTRVIEPVALMLINDRWHVHAYALPDVMSPKGGWRDFVLSRIGGTYGLMHPSTHTLESSEGMQMVTKTLVPHPKLTEDQQDTVGRAWKMKNRRLTITMTRNQYFYFEKQYVAKGEEMPPEKLLVLSDGA